MQMKNEFFTRSAAVVRRNHPKVLVAVMISLMIAVGLVLATEVNGDRPSHLRILIAVCVNLSIACTLMFALSGGFARQQSEHPRAQGYPRKSQIVIALIIVLISLTLSFLFIEA